MHKRIWYWQVIKSFYICETFDVGLSDPPLKKKEKVLCPIHNVWVPS